MKLTLAAFLALGLSVAVDAHIAKRGKETQTEFDQETTSFTSQGLCRMYKNGKHDPLELCYTYCKKKTDVMCQGTDTGPGSTPDYTDPKGEIFYMGKCTCQAPELAKIIAQEVIEALPEIAGLACTIMFGALNTVIDIGTAIVPGGEAVKGVETAVKAAKTLVENGQKAADYTNWFSHVCNPTDSAKVAELNNQVGKWFDPLTAVGDEIAKGAGCVLKDQSQCPKDSKSTSSVKTISSWSTESVSTPKAAPPRSVPPPLSTTKAGGGHIVTTTSKAPSSTKAAAAASTKKATATPVKKPSGGGGGSGGAGPKVI